MGSFIYIPCFRPELWSLYCPKKCIFCNFALTPARNLSMWKQFTYMDLKYLVTVFQKIIWLIRLWATAHEMLPIKIPKAMLTQQKFNKVFRFETLISVSIVSNNIFWKRLTRPFRCIYVNCFNILNFFCWGQYKIEKMHLFWQFKDHNSGREHENYTNNPIFSSTFSAVPACNIYFWIWKYLQFIFKFITSVYSGL